MPFYGISDKNANHDFKHKETSDKATPRGIPENRCMYL
jgi:hypothetical protein